MSPPRWCSQLSSHLEIAAAPDSRPGRTSGGTVYPGGTWSDGPLDLVRQEGDRAADAIAAGLRDSETVSVLAVLRRYGRNRDRLPRELPPAVREFLTDSGSLPPWFDRAKLDRGQRIFARYPADMLATLFYAALPECYAAADGTVVLLQSRRMAYAVLPRLMDTARFVIDVMSPGALGPAGSGVRSAQRVRWLHAVIRRGVVSTGWWDNASRAPVNQEELAGTLLAFSLVSIEALQKLGVQIEEDDREAYIHAWNVVGHLLGIRQELLPGSVAEARLAVEVLRRRNHRPSSAGRELAGVLLSFAASRFPPPARGLPAELMRFLVSDGTADLLGIPEDLRARQLVPLVGAAFRLRGRVTQMLPAARVLDIHNWLPVVRAVLWIETNLERGFGPAR